MTNQPFKFYGYVGDFAVSDHPISLLIDHPKLYARRRHAALFSGWLKLAV